MDPLFCLINNNERRIKTGERVPEILPETFIVINNSNSLSHSTSISLALKGNVSTSRGESA